MFFALEFFTGFWVNMCNDSSNPCSENVGIGIRIVQWKKTCEFDSSLEVFLLANIPLGSVNHRIMIRGDMYS